MKKTIEKISLGHLSVDQIVKRRAVCAFILDQDLSAVIAVHQANCRQVGCLVLVALEVRARKVDAQETEARS